MTVGRSTERSTGRSFLAVSAANGYIFLGGNKYPIGKSFSLRFFVRIFPYSLVFSQQSKEVFGLKLNNLFGVFARVWKIKKEFLGKDFDSTSSSWFLVFPKDFL